MCVGSIQLFSGLIRTIPRDITTGDEEKHWLTDLYCRLRMAVSTDLGGISTFDVYEDPTTVGV